MKFMRKSMALLFIIIFTVLFFTEGCSKKRDDPAVTSGKKRISMILKSSDSFFWKLVKAGANEAASKYNVSLEISGPGFETDIKRHLQLIEEQIKTKPDALIIASANLDNILPALKKAKSKKIPVAFIDSDLQWDDKLFYVGTDNSSAGYEIGTFMSTFLKRGDNVVIIRGAEKDINHIERAQGCEKALKASGINVSASEFCDSTYGKASLTMDSLIKQSVPFNAVFATNDEMALGVASSLRNQKKEVPVIGFDGILKALEAVRDGELKATGAQEAYKMGYLSIKTLMDHFEGKEIQKTVFTGITIVDKGGASNEITEIEKILKYN
jgi:ribose transport system substrate-binding protein